MINDQRQGRVAPPFTETLRAVRADPPGGWAGALVVVGLLFVVWLLWFCLAPLPVVVESRQVRVEAEELQVIAVEAATLRALRVQVGQSVEEGELLAELEVPGLEAEVAAAEAEARWLEAKTAELQRRLGPAGEAQQALRQQAEAEARAATERYTAAQVAEADAQQEVESLQRLLGARATTAADLQRAQSRLSSRQAERREAAATRAAALEQITVRLGEGSAVVLELLEIDGARAANVARRAALADRLRRAELHAARAGTVIEIAPLDPGAHVDTGSTLLTLATRGPMQVVAWFPADAVGQLAAGQPGSLSLAARPDTWFRPVPLQLLAVGAGEDARGVRVLLTPQEDVDLLHGMTGRVRVQVEASVPAALVLRSLGGG